MAVFFTSIIFVGIGITVFSLILMLYEKKQFHDYRSDLKEKRDQLISVIEDAEALIEEMNRFSDYTVTQIEEKNNILLDTLAKADSMIQKLISEASDQTLPGELKSTSVSVYDESSITKIIEEEKPYDENISSDYQIKGKVLTFDVKRKEIIKMARAGMNSTEIARILNCGKGEIELIARMGR